jgi:hypothetical protein
VSVLEVGYQVNIPDAQDNIAGLCNGFFDAYKNGAVSEDIIYLPTKRLTLFLRSHRSPRENRHLLNLLAYGLLSSCILGLSG